MLDAFAIFPRCEIKQYIYNKKGERKARQADILSRCVFLISYRLIAGSIHSSSRILGNDRNTIKFQSFESLHLIYETQENVQKGVLIEHEKKHSIKERMCVSLLIKNVLMKKYIFEKNVMFLS